MNSQLQSRTRVVGLWAAEAQAPIVISDPMKFQRLARLPIVKRPRACIAPVSFIHRVMLRLDHATRREIERLLSGGGLKWRDEFSNIVVNQGLNDLLGVTLSGTTQDTTWFVGLTSTTPTVAAGDTLASHAGWTEVTAYDEVNRVAWVDAGESAQSITNSASPAVFTISADGTVIGGAFLAGVNTGTGGRLYAAGAFTAADKSLDDNDVLNVTASFTTAAA
jgi:hypothetical protein